MFSIPATTVPNLENRFEAALGYPATTVPNLENRFKAGLGYPAKFRT